MLVNEQVAYVTPTYALSKLFWKYLMSRIPESLIKSANKSDLEIVLITGGSLKFFTGENLDSMRGWKFHYVVIDEAAYIADLEDKYQNAIRPTLTDYEGGMLAISTPNGLNFFMSLYTKGINEDSGFSSFCFTSYDNPYLLVSEINAAKSELPQIVFEQEYLARESANASNPFGLHIDKNVRLTLSKKPSLIYGIDLAKYNDYTVITGLDEDKNLSHFERFQLPWEKQLEKIIALPKHVHKYLDSTGVGSVVTEFCQSKTYNVHGITFTNQSKNDMVWKLVKDVESGTVTYNEMTATEMKTYEYKYTKTGLYSFNAQSGFHDDIVSSLMLANAHHNVIKASSRWKVHLV